MTTKEAIEILERHNRWRRDDTGKIEETNPKRLGIAIDKVVSYHKSEQITSCADEKSIKINLLKSIIEDIDGKYPEYHREIIEGYLNYIQSK